MNLLRIRKFWAGDEIYIIYIIFGLFCINPIQSSKLNELVIRSIDQLFDGSNNIIANSIVNTNTTINSNGQKNLNPWQNEGFIGANATQITSSLGSTIDISTKLLLAMQASTLTTQIKDFDHTFLSIKFSSIIGHSEIQPTTELPMTSDSEETSSTTYFPDAEEITSTSTPSRLPSPSVSVSLSKPSSNSNEDKVGQVEINSPHPRLSPSPMHSNVPQTSAKSSEQLSNRESKILTQKSEQIQKILPPLPPPKPSILKLNADGSDGHQVIEIAFDPAALSKSESTNVKKFKRSEEDPEGSIPAGNLEKVEPSRSVAVDPPGTNTNQDLKAIRKKRDLDFDSEEISQIHKILTFTKNMKTIDKQKEKEKLKPKLKTIQEEIIAAQDAQEAEDVGKADIKVAVAETVPENIKLPNKAKKLPYHTWRASTDKSFRPPGFYVTVDDKVVFDNWVGVWQSSQLPTVMGRWSAPKKNGIWNDTVLLLQFDETLDRNIKISFEWEPTDPNAYIFLSNISISTYGANSTPANLSGPQYFGDSNNLFGGGNRNITLYIVLKTPSQGTEQVIKMGDKPEVVEQRVLQPIVNTPTDSNSTNSISKPLPSNSNNNNKASSSIRLGNYLSPAATIPKGGSPTAQSNPSNPTSSTPQPASFTTTGLIVACVTGGFFLIILIFLIHKKLHIAKTPNHLSNIYIDEL